MAKKLYSFQSLKHMLISNKNVLGQTSFLMVAQGIVAVLSIFIKSIQTNTLGPELFGIFTFFLTTLHFGALLIRLGFLSTLRIIIANLPADQKQKEREWFGVAVVVALGLGLMYTMLLVIFSSYIDTIFSTSIGQYIRWFSPFLAIMVFETMSVSLTIASNKIKLLGWSQAMVSIGLFAALFSLKIAGFLDLMSLLLVYFLVHVIVLGALFIRLNPSFKNFWSNLKHLFTQNRQYGLKMYAGQVADQSTYKLDGIFITYFVDATTLGMYSLSFALTRPLNMLNSAFNQSYYKFLSNKEAISKRLMTLYTLTNIGILAGILLVAGPFVALVFGHEFSEVTIYLLPLGLATVLRSWHTPLKNFLNIRKKGNYTLISSVIMTSVNVLGNLWFIPIYGAIGAAWVSLGSVFVYAVCCYYFYRKTIT